MRKGSVVLYAVLSALSIYFVFYIPNSAEPTGGFANIILLIPLAIGATVTVIFLGLLILNIFLKEKTIDDARSLSRGSDKAAVIIGMLSLVISYFSFQNTSFEGFELMEIFFLKGVMFITGIILIVAGLPKTIDSLVNKLRKKV